MEKENFSLMNKGQRFPPKGQTKKERKKEKKSFGVLDLERISESVAKLATTELTTFSTEALNF